MNPNIVIHLLIVLITGAVLIYIYRANRVFFIIALLILLLIVLLIPEFLIPLELWEYLLKK
jgi:predicted membrane protein